MNDAEKAAFKLSKDAGRKSDVAKKKVRDLMKRSKAGEDVDAELEAAVKDMESCNVGLFEAIDVLKKLPEPGGAPTDAI